MAGNLNWQQVSSPSDTGAIYGVKSAADLLSNGFQSAQNALKTIQDSRSQAAQSQFLQNLSQYGSPEEVHAAQADGSLYRGVDRSLITPDVIKSMDDHVRSLTNNAYLNQQTQTMAANAKQAALDNQFNNDARSARQNASEIVSDAMANRDPRQAMDSLTRNPVFLQMSAADQQAAIAALNNRITGDRDFNLRQQQVNASTALEGAQTGEIHDRMGLARGSAALLDQLVQMPDAQSARELLANYKGDPRVVSSVLGTANQMYPGAFGQVNNADYPAGAFGQAAPQVPVGRGRSSSGSQGGSVPLGSDAFFANSPFDSKYDSAVNHAMSTVSSREKNSPFTSQFFQAAGSNQSPEEVTNDIVSATGANKPAVMQLLNRFVNHGMSYAQAGMATMASINAQHWYDFNINNLGNGAGYNNSVATDIINQFTSRNTPGSAWGAQYQRNQDMGNTAQQATNALQNAYAQYQASSRNLMQVKSRVGSSSTAAQSDALDRAKARLEYSEKALRDSIQSAGQFNTGAPIPASAALPAPTGSTGPAPTGGFDVNQFIQNMGNPQSADYQRYGTSSR